MNNNKKYNAFIKLFSRYADDEKLKKAFFITEVEGFVGIHIGNLFAERQISLEELRIIIDSGILDDDLPSLKLLKYLVYIEEEKCF